MTVNFRERRNDSLKYLHVIDENYYLIQETDRLFFTTREGQYDRLTNNSFEFPEWNVHNMKRERISIHSDKSIVAVAKPRNIIFLRRTNQRTIDMKGEILVSNSQNVNDVEIHFHPVKSHLLCFMNNRSLSILDFNLAMSSSSSYSMNYVNQYIDDFRSAVWHSDNSLLVSYGKEMMSILDLRERYHRTSESVTDNHLCTLRLKKYNSNTSTFISTCECESNVWRLWDIRQLTKPIYCHSMENHRILDIQWNSIVESNLFATLYSPNNSNGSNKLHLFSVERINLFNENDRFPSVDIQPSTIFEDQNGAEICSFEWCSTKTNKELNLLKLTQKDEIVVTPTSSTSSSDQQDYLMDQPVRHKRSVHHIERYSVADKLIFGIRRDMLFWLNGKNVNIFVNKTPYNALQAMKDKKLSSTGFTTTTDVNLNITKYQTDFFALESIDLIFRASKLYGIKAIDDCCEMVQGNTELFFAWDIFRKDINVSHPFFFGISDVPEEFNFQFGDEIFRHIWKTTKRIPSVRTYIPGKSNLMRDDSDTSKDDDNEKKINKKSTMRKIYVEICQVSEKKQREDIDVRFATYVFSLDMSSALVLDTKLSIECELMKIIILNYLVIVDKKQAENEEDFILSTKPCKINAQQYRWQFDAIQVLYHPYLPINRSNLQSGSSSTTTPLRNRSNERDRKRNNLIDKTSEKMTKITEEPDDDIPFTYHHCVDTSNQYEERQQQKFHSSYVRNVILFLSYMLRQAVKPIEEQEEKKLIGIFQTIFSELIAFGCYEPEYFENGRNSIKLSDNEREVCRKFKHIYNEEISQYGRICLFLSQLIHLIHMKRTKSLNFLQDLLNSIERDLGAIDVGLVALTIFLSLPIIVYDDNLSLIDRIPLAFTYLPSNVLKNFIHDQQILNQLDGNLIGLIFSGMNEQYFLPLAQSYIDRTGDVQTIIYLTVRSKKWNLIKHRLSQQWISQYRQFLNLNKCWKERCLFDVWRNNLIRCVAASTLQSTSEKNDNNASTIATTLGLAHQLENYLPTDTTSTEHRPTVLCNFCSRPISLLGYRKTQWDKMTIFKHFTKHGRRMDHFDQSVNLPSSKVGRVNAALCPHCQNSLPRCSICYLHLGSLSSTDNSNQNLRSQMDNGVISELHGTLNDSGYLPIDAWFTWCQTCLHGGHYSHIDEWFKKHEQCPVLDCKCTCRIMESSDYDV
ncbi:hypothetical protein SNEBB_001352 [Seison nebaliae]|nr:hypothetical protein SNEBB_001352 [Seison nebaliae]